MDGNREAGTAQGAAQPGRALAPYEAAPERMSPRMIVRPDSGFLASLIASRMNAETVRSRRKADPAIAIACYRAALGRSSR